MYKTDNIKTGDTIYSLDRDNIAEWEILGKNPKNERFFIIVNKETNAIKQVHWKTIEYGTNNTEEFFSVSLDDLLDNFRTHANRIISNINKERNIFNKNNESS